MMGIAVLVAHALPQTEAATLGGYFRTGIAGSSVGGRQSCFGLPGAQARLRLGNECQTYTELTLSQILAQSNNGVYVTGVGTLAAGTEEGHAPTFRGTHGRMRGRQIYLEAGGITGLRGGNLWLGRRFYKRHAVHINDFFFWTTSGVGAGVENMRVGIGELSYAYFRQGDAYDKHKAVRHDIHMGGWRINQGGTLMTGLSLIPKSKQYKGAHGGWSLNSLHVQQTARRGLNQFAVQYGQGPGIGLGQAESVTTPASTQRWRIVQAYTWQTTPSFGGQWTIVYQNDRDHHRRRQRWWSYGVRPVIALTSNWKLAVELGQDWVKPSRGNLRRLDKITIAPTLTKAMAGGFSDRPELRFFYTYARWNRSAQRSAPGGHSISATGRFGASRHGSTFGVQLETWF